MVNLNKPTILKVNSAWRPIGFTNIKKMFPDMANGAIHGLHLAWEIGEDGEYNFDSPSEMYPVTSWDEWVQLPIREYDEWISTPTTKVRIPPIVIAVNFDQMPTSTPRMCKRAIMERDGYRCMYTGKTYDPSTARKHLNIDHVIPRSKGGKTSWDNLVTCDRRINSKKSDLTPEQAGLELLAKPSKPSPRPISEEVYKQHEQHERRKMALQYAFMLKR